MRGRLRSYGVERWWEALRAPEVAKWQQKHRVVWDATDGRNGGAQRTVWENLLEIERSKYRTGEEGWRAVAVVLDLTKAFERTVSHWCGPGQRTSASQGRYCGCYVGYFVHLRRVQFEGCAAEPLRSITAILSGSKWSCLLLRIVLQDALSEVTKIYPPLKLRDFCG